MPEEAFGSDKMVVYLHEVDSHPAFSNSERLLYMTIIRECDIPYFNNTNKQANESEPRSRGVMNIPLKESIFLKEDGFSELLDIEPLTCYAFVSTMEDGTAIPFSEFIYKASQRPDVVGALERYARKLEG